MLKDDYIRDCLAHISVFTRFSFALIYFWLKIQNPRSQIFNPDPQRRHKEKEGSETHNRKGPDIASGIMLNDTAERGLDLSCFIPRSPRTAMRTSFSKEKRTFVR